MGSPVVHFEVVAKDGKKAQGFYSSLFGWKINADNPVKYGLVDTESEGKGIGGGIAEAQEGMHDGVTFYVEVPDLQATLDKAEGLGGKTVMPVTDIPGMVTLAVFTDPEGHPIGIVAPQPPPAS